MALLDKISKIAKTVGDEAVNAAKKSGDFIETSKLSHSISSEEDKINAILLEIGNVCYQKFKANEEVDPDILNSCRKIEEINHNIAAIKQRILEIKSNTACPSCGSEIAQDVMFCPKCGAKQDTQETLPLGKEEPKVCPNCAAHNDLDADFCSSCGTKI